MNQFLSRLDEQQRRWYAAIEAKKLGHGGTKQISQITGLHANTIRRGRRELASQLQDCPNKRVRQVGGGRRPLKKTRTAKLAGEPSAPGQLDTLPGNGGIVVVDCVCVGKL
jgi:hypothetical protein